MSRLRVSLLVALTLALPAVATSTHTFAATPSRVTPQGTISWQSTGDSYSSGEGAYRNVGACAQADQAYGPQSANALRDRGWDFGSVTFTACSGHLVEDYFNSRADSGGKDSLWDWGRKGQGGPDKVDVITMSFGGNDIGFDDVMLDCLDVPNRWSDVTGLAPSGCDTSESDIAARMDYLLDPSDRACSGSRRTGTDGFDCKLNLGERRGSIIDFYYDLVTQRLTDRGQLYVVGYPRIFASVDQWPGWIKTYCQGVSRGDTEKLGRNAEHFNAKLVEAVSRVNEALGAERVHFVDRLAAFGDGKHELCGTNEDWLNGVAVDRDDGLGIRYQTSFHPNLAGHQGTADILTQLVESTFPEKLTIRPGTDAAPPRPNLPPGWRWLEVPGAAIGIPGALVERADSNANARFSSSTARAIGPGAFLYSVSISPLTAFMPGSREPAVIADLSAYRQVVDQQFRSDPELEAVNGGRPAFEPVGRTGTLDVVRSGSVSGSGDVSTTEWLVELPAGGVIRFAVEIYVEDMRGPYADYSRADYLSTIWVDPATWEGPAPSK